MSRNPRKFCDKIALLEKRQAEGNAEYERIIREVEATVSQPTPRLTVITSSSEESEEIRAIQDKLAQTICDFQDQQQNPAVQYHQYSNQVFPPENSTLIQSNHHQQHHIYSSEPGFMLKETNPVIPNNMYGIARAHQTGIPVISSQDHQQQARDILIHNWQPSLQEAITMHQQIDHNPNNIQISRQVSSQQQTNLPPMRARVASQGAYNPKSAPILLHHHNQQHHLNNRLTNQNNVSCHEINNSNAIISSSATTAPNVYLDPNQRLWYRSSSDSALDQQPHGRWSVTEPANPNLIFTNISLQQQQQQAPLQTSPSSISSVVHHHSPMHTQSPESVPVIHVFDADDMHSQDSQHRFHIQATELMTSPDASPSIDIRTPATTTTSISNSPIPQHHLEHNTHQTSLYHPQTNNTMTTSMRDLHSSAHESQIGLTCDSMIRCHSFNDIMYR